MTGAYTNPVTCNLEPDWGLQISINGIAPPATMDFEQLSIHSAFPCIRRTSSSESYAWQRAAVSILKMGNLHPTA